MVIFSYHTLYMLVTVLRLYFLVVYVILVCLLGFRTGAQLFAFTVLPGGSCLFGSVYLVPVPVGAMFMLEVVLTRQGSALQIHTSSRKRHIHA